MAINDTFLLRSNEFEGIIKSCWKELQTEDDLCDITLAFENRQIKTHKFVISGFSPVLRNILKLHQNSHPMIYLRKVKYTDLQNLIAFMYQGEVDVAEEDLHSFLEGSEDLKVRGLFEENTEGLNSSGEFSSEPSRDQDFAQSPKRERIIENEQNVQVNNDNPSEMPEIEDLINNNDAISSHTPTNVILKTNITTTNTNIVSTIGEKQFQCQRCDKSFSGRGALYNHTKSSHEGVKYSCTQCNFKGTTKQLLQQHVASVHEGVKYPCSECNYKATHMQILQQHVASIHNGVKYPCTDCNYKATFRENLLRHVASFHEGLHLFHCNQCEYKAGRKATLRVHLEKTHNR